MYFKYGEKETAYLCEKDETLGAFIKQTGHINRVVIPDLFEGFVNSIISQQISSKALETVWSRIKDMLGSVTPDKILQLGVSGLSGIGMSGRKAECIVSAAKSICDGTLNLQELSTLENDEFISRLTTLKGVGVWTAQMLLIFSLRRGDVFPDNDYGVQKGLMALHNLKEITKENCKAFREIYSPFGSVAAIYLWEAARTL